MLQGPPRKSVRRSEGNEEGVILEKGGKTTRNVSCHQEVGLRRMQGWIVPNAFIQLSINTAVKASMFPAPGILMHVYSKKSENEFWT